MNPRTRTPALILTLALLALLSACKSPSSKTLSPGKGAPAHVETPDPPKTNAGPVLVNRCYVEASYEDVWREFVTERGYSRWYSAPIATFEAQVGGKVAWGSKDSPLISGEISRIDKGRGLSHTFQFAWIPDEVSPVTINILQQGKAVRVEIIHDCRKAPETAKIIGVWGWQKALSRLKTLLETGKAMPWPEDTPKVPSEK